MALDCPQCAALMNEVKAEATTGYLLLLDQCCCCGGIWCDKWEALPLTSTAAARLDPVDAEALRTPQLRASETLRCPRCRARMRRFQDPALPADAQIDRCLNCEGMWFNRGALRRYKQHAPAAPKAVQINTLDGLASAVCDPQSWPTVRHLDDALRARPQDDEAEARENLMHGAAWLIVRAALRLLFGL